jgi:hypothetical protein
VPLVSFSAIQRIALGSQHPNCEPRDGKAVTGRRARSQTECPSQQVEEWYLELYILLTTDLVNIQQAPFILKQQQVILPIAMYTFKHIVVFIIATAAVVAAPVTQNGKTMLLDHHICFHTDYTFSPGSSKRNCPEAPVSKAFLQYPATEHPLIVLPNSQSEKSIMLAIYAMAHTDTESWFWFHLSHNLRG